MDDQVFAEDLSLESLIREGRVTHLCSGDAGLDETAVLTALCDAVGGQIYRIDPLTYVFRIGEDDLNGALAGAPPERWADALGRRLRGALRLADGAGGVHVRALRRETAPSEPEPNPELEPEPEVAKAPAAPDPAPTVEPDAAPPPEEAAVPEPDAEDLPAEDPTTEDPPAEDPPGEDAEPGGEAPAASAASDPVLARLDALEAQMGELRGGVAALAERAEAQARSGRTLERMMEELAGELRRLPERAARHGAAHTASLAPLSLALTGALRRLEEGEDAPGSLSLGEGLAQVRDEVAALSRRLEAQPAAPDDLAGRLDRLGADLRGLPERVAGQMAARTASLAPMHVALSGALHRLERQIEALDGAGSDAGLRLEMAEFLARMERRIPSPAVE